ncbi:hypothetical protein AXF42_Ash020001 [Apostasia shenzhenica]|uniref:SOSEKI DIX-like domain-containing protein n=1 Tax=Apostasia shenzhenica TaxID=1088818 RepID=A0A2H9ZSI4_9ASPA|nr:hypothetical protein AXF42_Ash020001 [Apostasia shenzhenica]
MGVADTGGRAELSRHRNERDASPERTKVWTEPSPKKVSVIYYLSRNGQLEHPHFMEVSPSSSHGLCLRDVMNRLDFLRGKGMASLYSWSSKRSYKNGFVWHDLSEKDLIFPVHGYEYILKGSELFQSSSSSVSERSMEKISKTVQEVADFPPGRRKKAPWSSLDLAEYKVYKADCAAGASGKAAHAATQTEDMGRMRRPVAENDGRTEIPTTELGLGDISPPPSSPSPETVNSMIRADRQVVVAAAEGGEEHEQTAGSCPSGRLRSSASAVLMHLISCGSFSMAPEYSGRLPRGGAQRKTDIVMDSASFSAMRVLEDRDNISGSLIETKKKTHGGGGSGGDAADSPDLQRSASFNGDRSSAMEEGDEGCSKCLSRKPTEMMTVPATATAAAKEGNAPVFSQSAPGSKRF